MMTKPIWTGCLLLMAVALVPSAEADSGCDDDLPTASWVTCETKVATGFVVGMGHTAVERAVDTFCDEWRDHVSESPCPSRTWFYLTDSP